MSKIPKKQEVGGKPTKESSLAGTKRTFPMATRRTSESNILSVLHRYDGNIAVANQKASFLIGLAGVVLVAGVAKHAELLVATEIASVAWLNDILYLIAGLGLLGVLSCSLWVVLPTTKSGDKHSEYTSLIAYSSVAKMDAEIFRSKLASADYDFWSDLVRQTHLLARITTAKFLFLGWATWLTLTSVASIAILFLLAVFR
ncbi:unnamed protein product [marine sediment metagenome]|uniref:Pycsar effector protein domain-containing protein n=1 Tax=marine sediment metagenome TaxID=412755 RepID=X1TMB3_9ZZZZ